MEYYRILWNTIGILWNTMEYYILVWNTIEYYWNTIEILRDTNEIVWYKRYYNNNKLKFNDIHCITHSISDTPD